MLASAHCLEWNATRVEGTVIFPYDTHDDEDLLERFYDRVMKQGPNNIFVLLDPSACSSIWIGALVSGRDESKVKRYTPGGHSSGQWKRNWADRWMQTVETPHEHIGVGGFPV